MVLWSPTAKLAYIVELTVPWEDGVEEAYEKSSPISFTFHFSKHKA